MSIIDLRKCEDILKEKFDIDEDTPLIILKFEKSGTVAYEKNV